MQKTLLSFTEAALNQPLWNVRVRGGSMLAFEIGKPVEEGRGEFHFAFQNCHWWLQQGSDTVQDIMNSESDQSVMAEKVKVLEGKKLVHVEFNEELGATVFDFEDELFLRVAPYGKDEAGKQFQIFTPDDSLAILASGETQIAHKNA